MKTAVQQIIDTLIDTKETKCTRLHEFLFFDGVLAIIEAGGFLDIEKTQITNAFKEGLSDAHKPAQQCLKSINEYYSNTFDTNSLP